MTRCIYCGVQVDPQKGEGDHVIPRAFGEFRGAANFMRICVSCNNSIGHSEQELLQCSPESFLLRVVQPNRGGRGERGWVGAVRGTPTPRMYTEFGGFQLRARPHTDDPRNASPIDLLIIRDDRGKEHELELAPGITEAGLRAKVERLGIGELRSGYLSCDEAHWSHYSGLVARIWPKAAIKEDVPIEAGVHRRQCRIRYTFTDRYFRSLAKMAFHYYLLGNLRGLAGHEPEFAPLRRFILEGGDPAPFFLRDDAELAIVFPGPGGSQRWTPPAWCHVLSANEAEPQITVCLILFAGPTMLPRPHYVTLGRHRNPLLLPGAVKLHIFQYGDVGSRRFAGWVDAVPGRQGWHGR